MTGKYFCFSCCLLFACLSPLNSQQSSTDARHDEWSGQRGLENEIIVLEHNYWEAWKNKDAKTLAQIRAADFREADQDGVLDKKEAEQVESDMEITSYVLKNEKVVALQPALALLTYEVAYKGSYNGNDISSPHAYVASLYVRRDDAWQLAYSQETAAKENLPDASLSAQALAKEREIQEAQKNNDWTKFADLLSDDLVAIDEDGIHSKKELLESIKAADIRFSDYKMEDVRTIPEGNGAIVAYRQTLAGTEHGNPFTRHIYTHSHWERRGCKWLLTMFQDSMAKEQK